MAFEYVDNCCCQNLAHAVRKGLQVSQITFRGASSFGSTNLSLRKIGYAHENTKILAS
jgi:hypothetical protein